MQPIQPSPTLALDARVKAMQKAGITVINLTAGEPDFRTPFSIQRAAIAALRAGFTRYTPSAGIFELREAVARKLWRENSIRYTPDDIIVGVGSKHILALAFQVLCKKGDEVIIPTPAWSTYIEQVKLAGAAPVLAPMQPPFKATAALIKKHLSQKTRAVVLNTPSNPTGTVVEPEELRRIARLAAARNFFVIADEMYEKILYGGKHLSIASLGEEIKKRTITVNGFSKAYAMTGWRVGYGAGPRGVIAEMAAIASQTTSGTSSISQKAAVAAYTAAARADVRKMVREFAKRRQFVYSALSRIKGISVTKPEGAFYVFPDIRRLLGARRRTSAEWAAALLEKAKVAVVPGEAFSAPGYIRISYAASLADLRAGIHRIQRFIR